MAKKTNIKYQQIDNYNRYLKMLVKRKLTFKEVWTTYSKKVITNDLTIIFNPDGESDFNTLSLINMVRKNAVEYAENTSYEKRNEYIHFFDLFKKPKSDEVIWKVDIKSAYWLSALKKGVITEITNQKLYDIYKEVPEHLDPVKQIKKARLKALGSLATTKVTYNWIKGVRQPTNPEDVITEKTKDIYMDICRDVDRLMRDCVNENHSVIYYYWDCIFVPRDTAQGVLDFFKKREYAVSIDETKLTYVPLSDNGGGYIISESDNKAYMVRKDSIGLLDDLR
jgi:hypothetical protein